jgi:hypothetical protein
MADEPFSSPKWKPPPPRVPKRGDLLFEFVRADHVPFRCEIRDDGAWGFEAQFYRSGELLIGRRFATCDLAMQWAEDQRKAIEKGR